jgi:hypothetical protein
VLITRIKQARVRVRAYIRREGSVDQDSQKEYCAAGVNLQHSCEWPLHTVFTLHLRCSGRFEEVRLPSNTFVETVQYCRTILNSCEWPLHTLCVLHEVNPFTTSAPILMGPSHTIEYHSAMHIHVCQCLNLHIKGARLIHLVIPFTTLPWPCHMISQWCGPVIHLH